MIDHYFTHSNTPPFIAKKLIQRFTTSNPSPRYVEAVANTFRNGSYVDAWSGEAFGTGQYGDLAATTAAILLDREARSTTLDADGTHGHNREPVLKLMHFLRSMEYASRDGREVELDALQDSIGAAVFYSPTVFNFYLPEYQPSGVVADAGLYAPEVQLMTGPMLIGYLNGLYSLISWGLTSCYNGFGTGYYAPDTSCSSIASDDAVAAASWEGNLTYAPPAGTDTSNASAVIAELDLLLTSGRLNSYGKGVITVAYENELSRTGSTAKALGVAQFLIASAPEFHASNKNRLSGIPRSEYEVPTAAPSQPPSFKPTVPRSHAPTPTPTMAPSYCAVNVSIDTSSDMVLWSRLGANGATANVTVPHGFYSLETLAAAWSALTVRASDGTMWGLDVKLDADNHTYKFGFDEAWTSGKWVMKGTANKGFWNAIGHDYKTAGSLSNTAPTTSELSLGCAPAPTPVTAPYKAIVFLFLNGACDSYNMLVPHSQCDANKVNEQYTSVRGDVALTMDELLQIHVPNGTQPCNKFGVHPDLDYLQGLYEDKEAAFIANIGALVEPITKHEYNTGAKTTPPSLFAHNIMQRSAMNLQAQQADAKGVLGRIQDILSEDGYDTAAYSINGNTKAVEAELVSADVIDKNRGVTLFTAQDELGDQLYNLTEYVSESIFAETFADKLSSSLKRSIVLDDALSDVSLTQTFSVRTRAFHYDSSFFCRVSRSVSHSLYSCRVSQFCLCRASAGFVCFVPLDERCSLPRTRALPASRPHRRARSLVRSLALSPPLARRPRRAATTSSGCSSSRSPRSCRRAATSARTATCSSSS